MPSSSELLYTDPVVAVLPSDHRLAGGPLRLHDLANERFVVCDRNIAPTIADKITSLCAQAGFPPNIVQTSNLVSSVLTLVEARRRRNAAAFLACSIAGSAISPSARSSIRGGIDLVMAWFSPKREGRNAQIFS